MLSTSMQTYCKYPNNEQAMVRLTYILLVFLLFTIWRYDHLISHLWLGDTKINEVAALIGQSIKSYIILAEFKTH